MPKKSPVEILKTGNLEDMKGLFEQYRLPDRFIDEALLEKYKAKNNGKRAITLQKNRTPLHYAALNPNPEVIDFLLKKMTKYHKDFDYDELEQYFLTYRDEDQKALLHYAARNKNAKTIEYLFDKLCKLRKSSHPHETDREIKQYFLSQKDIDGYTPLLIAVLNGVFPAIKFFIENGANYKEIKMSGLNIIQILKHDAINHYERYAVAKQVEALIQELEKNPTKEDRDLNPSSIIERPLNSIKENYLDSLPIEKNKVIHKEEKNIVSYAISSLMNSLGMLSIKSKTSDKNERSIKEPLLPSKLKPD